MTGIEIIAAEREAHFSREGWTPERDDAYRKGELARAAVAYAFASYTNYCGIPRFWPWDRSCWKIANPIRILAKAGALIAAEIDRRLRAGEEADNG